MTISSSQSHKLSRTEIIKEYYKLCKPNVVALLILTAVVGMLLASPTLGQIPLNNFILGIIGITLMSAAAAVINQIIDQRFDEKMNRTQNRPIPKGYISNNKALIFAVILTILGASVLILWVNWLTAILTFIALIGYAFIYTIYLKHATPQNIVIGGASGAVPPLLGWTAITNQVSIEALILFLIIFIWTPPHFWALAIYRHKDYSKAKIPMLPVTHGIAFTRQNILLYKILLIIISLLPFVVGMSNILYLILALTLGLWYLYYAIQMLRYPDDEKLPIKSFVVSIWYLMLLFIALLIDHYATAYLGHWFGHKIPI